VRVEYLWTGAEGLARVDAGTDVLAAPDAAAEVVGFAAGRASVPVQCVQGRWLRVGPNEYVDAAAVRDPPQVGACTPGPTRTP
jgi:hypothetical protein